VRCARLFGVALVGVVFLTGCYAQTQPATDVGSETATLRAHGTADHGQAESWFEYEVSGRVGDPQQTGQLTWPGGASGPIIQKVTDLSAGTSYSFRICGTDVQTDPVCAQTKTFTTKPPTEDVAHGGWWSGCCNSFGVNARSGPGGENPTGSMNLRAGNSFDPVSRSFGGTVTCLEVDGRQAVIGAVGQVTTSPPGTSNPATLLALVVDGVTAADEFEVGEIVSGSTPPNCATATFGSPSEAQDWFEFVVNDAP
jgi:hypothetical protein